MVNLYGLYVAVVLLWRFRLQVVPLSLGTSYSLSASCVTRKKISRKRAVTVTINGLTERGNTPCQEKMIGQRGIFSCPCLIAILHFVKQKRCVGRRCLASLPLLCFMNRLTG